MVVKERSTRDRILALAVAALDEGGDPAVRVKAISDQAGVSVASLYHFFGDREGLIEAAHAERFHRGRSEVLDRFGEAVASCQDRDDFIAALRTSIVAVSSSIRRHDRLARAHALGATIGRPQLLARLVEDPTEARTLADIFAGAQRRGWVDAHVDVAAVADWTRALLFGRVLVEQGNESDLEAWTELTVQAVTAALTGGHRTDRRTGTA